MNKIKIGLFGHYGNNNIGDESIILAVFQNLKQRLPEAEIIGFSLTPEDSKKRLGIDSYPIRYQSQDRKADRSDFINSINNLLAYKMIERPIKELRFLIRVFRRLKNLDLLVVCGSNQFIDTFGGLRGYPYTILKWVLLSRLRGVKVAFASVGAGPIENPATYRLLKPALLRADYLSYRDQGSKEYIESHIPELDGNICPDLAHALTTTPAVVKKETDKVVVGVNPIPIFDRRYWYIGNEEKYRRYVSELTLFTKNLIDSGYRVRLFNTHPKDILVINDIVTELREMGELQNGVPEVVQITTVEQLLNVIASLNVVVATRFHANVLPLRLGIPVLGICYYRKTKELLIDMGLEDFHVDVQDFTHRDLKSKMDLILKNSEELKRKVESNFQHYKVMLDEQFDKITDLVKK